MHGPTSATRKALDRILLTPEMATQLLEHNQLNRPLRDRHVMRIAGQIKGGKWRFNGDTIKIAKGGDILDGQHRLWAVIESKTAVDTLIVKDIDREAFATIDTIRSHRNASDTLALNGATRHRPISAAAIQWLIRWQRGILPEYRAPQNRIENSDVEAFYQENKGVERAVERAMTVRRIGNPSIIAFLYYITANRDLELAERMIAVFNNPSVSVSDPFFVYRSYFTTGHHQHKDSLMSIALGIKALNASKQGLKVKALNWRSQGKNAEEFPKLKV